VPCEREYGVIPRHAGAVIRDANTGAATLRHVDLDGARVGIESILEQLLDDGRRPFDDLARRDLVDDSAGQDGDVRHA
jgi:hypothetical protein